MDTKELKQRVRGFLRVFEKNSEILETIEGKTFEILTPTKRHSKLVLLNVNDEVPGKALKRKSVFSKEMVLNNLASLDQQFLTEKGTKIIC